jgi:hypothetical protein
MSFCPVVSPSHFPHLQTPGSQQWWIFKAANMDTVLFFKQGKFYETFHMDTDTCVRELGLIYMKGWFARAFLLQGKEHLTPLT